MWFLLPTNLKSLFSDTGADRDPLQIYINPQSIDIKESKLVSHTLAKGGYIVQYWGEELPVMSVEGTTGSGGIEAINILRDIYRSEQLTMRRVLLSRANRFGDDTNTAIENSSSATTAAGLLEAIDTFAGGAATDIVEGTRSAIEEVTDAFLGISDDSSKIGLVPSLGAFAISVDIFFQGVKYRGFFKDFSARESADSPGLFNYSFTFMITRIMGKRQNFMPWHRSPTTIDGTPRTASIPTAGAVTDELSFATNAEYGDTQNRIISDRMTSLFNDIAGEIDPNNVGVNRRGNF